MKICHQNWHSLTCLGTCGVFTTVSNCNIYNIIKKNYLITQIQKVFEKKLFYKKYYLTKIVRISPSEILETPLSSQKNQLEIIKEIFKTHATYWSPFSQHLRHQCLGYWDLNLWYWGQGWWWSWGWGWGWMNCRRARQCICNTVFHTCQVDYVARELTDVGELSLLTSRPRWSCSE